MSNYLPRSGRGWGDRLAATLEIGSVPAVTLELEACGRKQLGVTFLAAGWAGGERRIAHFLQVFLLKTAGIAAIFVNRHENPPKLEL
jgi:hypothetical protein